MMRAMESTPTRSRPWRGIGSPRPAPTRPAFVVAGASPAGLARGWPETDARGSDTPGHSGRSGARGSGRRRRPSRPLDVTLRDASASDLDQIAAIWNHEVLWTDATTDTEPRDAAAQREWLARHPEPYPVVVAVAGQHVVAYGSLSPYRPRPAFAHTVEDSVYVEGGHRGAGLGRLILAELVRRAVVAGHHSIMARITSRNTASLRLHRRHGFRTVGVERQTAFKLGRWHDVTIMQRRLDARGRTANAD